MCGGEDLPGNAYLVERAFAGQEEIAKYLRENKQGLAPYADMLESGRLINERGKLGAWLEKQGFNWILPHRLRFSD